MAKFEIIKEVEPVFKAFPTEVRVEAVSINVYCFCLLRMRLTYCRLAFMLE